MKNDNVRIIAFVLAVIAVILFLPRPKDNPYHIESIINDEKSINVQYPKTGNKRMDSKIEAHVKNIMEEYSKKEGKWGLNVSFRCFFSPIEIIRVKTTFEDKENNKKHTSRKYFFGLKPKNKYVPENASGEQNAPEGQKFFDKIATLEQAKQKERISSGSVKERVVDKEKKLIALTFDDGPSEYTASIIDVFNANDSKATFCVLGSRVGAYRDTVKQMHLTGHEIANHTYNHKKLTSLKTQAMRDEIQKTQDAVYEITGEAPVFLRPTYGAFNKSVRQTAQMPLLMWSIDTLDWKTQNADYVYKHVIDNAKDCDIILFHDTYPTTLEAVKRIVPYLNENGFQIVTVSELLEAKGVNPENGKAYFSATKKS